MSAPVFVPMSTNNTYSTPTLLSVVSFSGRTVDFVHPFPVAHRERSISLVARFERCKRWRRHSRQVPHQRVTTRGISKTDNGHNCKQTIPPLLPAPRPENLGSGANYIIPAVFNISLLKRLGAHRGVLSEVSLNKAIIVFGAVFMVMGTVVTLKEAGAHH